MSTISLGQSLLLDVASVQFDWSLVFVVADDGFALLHNFFDLGTVFAFRQLFNGNIFLEFSLAVDETQFSQETFTEFLQSQRKTKFNINLKLVTASTSESVATTLGYFVFV